MKLAYDYQIFAQQGHGGISRYHARLAAALAAAGHGVRIVAPLHINAYLGDLPDGIVTGRRVAASLWGNRAMRLVDRLMVPPLLARFAPDIVHPTYYAPCRSPRRARSVITVHDMIHEKFPDQFPPGDRTAAAKARAIARADHVLCVSHNTLADLVAIHPTAAARASVTQLGFDPLPAVAAPVAGPRPYLLFVGHRAGYKNFGALLAAIAASPLLRGGFDLVAIGGGAMTTAESADIAGHGLTGQVRHIVADEAELAAHYAGAAALVYPTLYEGFGLPPLEAMAAGCPVIAVRAGSVPEVCGDAALYAESGEAEALRDAIERLVTSPGRAAGLVAAGRARLAHFSWSRCAAETAAAYRSLL